MAFNGANVLVNPGALTWEGTDLGLKAEATVIRVADNHLPLTSEDFGDIPFDYVFVGGEIVVTAVLMEAATAQVRTAVIGHRANSAGTGLLLGTKDSAGVEIVGRKMSALKMGTLAWTTAGPTGTLQFSASRAVPIIGFDAPFEITLSRRREVRYACSWICLPPAAGGACLTVTPTS